MTKTEQLEKIKAALGIGDTYHDETLMIFLEECRDYLKDAGVNSATINSTKAIGILCRGVTDLWNYGSGTGKLSAYFYERASQLYYEDSKSEETEDITNDELEEILKKVIEEYFEAHDVTSGKDGKTAYEIAVEKGFTGSETEWLESLHGDKGEKGDKGDKGIDGDSAYDIAIANGFSGTVAEWLDSLKGEKGDILRIETISNTETELDVTVKANVVLRIFKPVTKLNVSVETVRTYAEWNFIFTVAESGCTLTVPEWLVWDGNEAPVLQPNKTYEVSISNMTGIAYISKGAII
ncbi:MAG: hypothetical protein K2M46_10485 [Lachnospiraceae bacterium]|nr:hypothetical protein [Lachnospiraceae bacterium]